MEITSKKMNIENIISSHKNNLLYIEKVLKEYETEDKAYLLLELNNLSKKNKMLSRFFNILRNFDEGVHCKLQKYFLHFIEEFQMEFQDFLFLLRWNNFEGILKKLQNLCDKKSSIPAEDLENYKILLNTLKEEV